MSKYKSVAIREEDSAVLEATKDIYEKDFGRKISWSEFFRTLCMGYCVGRTLVMADDKMVIAVTDQD